MKVGVIRCELVAENCPGSSCFEAMREKKGAFEGVEEEIIVVGFMTCGGCPGKKVSFKVKALLEKGADTIAISSCITKGYPVGKAFVCPNAEEIKKAVEATVKKIKPEARILDWTH